MALDGIAVADFDATHYNNRDGHHYLSLVKGAALRFVKAEEDGWAFGSDWRGEEGWFPKEYWKPRFPAVEEQGSCVSREGEAKEATASVPASLSSAALCFPSSALGGAW